MKTMLINVDEQKRNIDQNIIRVQGKYKKGRKAKHARKEKTS